MKTNKYIIIKTDLTESWTTMKNWFYRFDYDFDKNYSWLNTISKKEDIEIVKNYYTKKYIEKENNQEQKKILIGSLDSAIRNIGYYFDKLEFDFNKENWIYTTKNMSLWKEEIDEVLEKINQELKEKDITSFHFLEEIKNLDVLDYCTFDDKIHVSYLKNRLENLLFIIENKWKKLYNYSQVFEEFRKCKSLKEFYLDVMKYQITLEYKIFDLDDEYDKEIANFLTQEVWFSSMKWFGKNDLCLSEYCYLTKELFLEFINNLWLKHFLHNNRDYELKKKWIYLKAEHWNEFVLVRQEKLIEHANIHELFEKQLKHTKEVAKNYSWVVLDEKEKELIIFLWTKIWKYKRKKDINNSEFVSIRRYIFEKFDLDIVNFAKQENNNDYIVQLKNKKWKIVLETKLWILTGELEKYFSNIKLLK